jgi:hypothetical protein
MKRPDKLKQGKVLLAFLDVTSLDSFRELVIDCRNFLLNIMSCLLVLKAYLNLDYEG